MAEPDEEIKCKRPLREKLFQLLIETEKTGKIAGDASLLISLAMIESQDANTAALERIADGIDRLLDRSTGPVNECARKGKELPVEFPFRAGFVAGLAARGLSSDSEERTVLYRFVRDLDIFQ